MYDDRRPILLCLDLEAGSDVLARIGAGYARRLGQPLHILYVLPRSGGETEDAAMERLQGLVAGAIGGVDSDILVVRKGCIEEQIVDYVKENAIDMVILGHRHKARRERVYVGSTVKTVISLAPGRILVVPVNDEE